MVWPPETHQDVTDEVTTLRDGRGWAATLGGRQQIGETQKASPVLWRPGRWYSAYLSGTTTTATPAASDLRLVPVYMPASRTIDRIGCNVTTAGTAGHVARLGVYNADPGTGLPTTVRVDAGTVAVDTTGVKEVAITATLHGLHWLGVTTQSGAFTAFSAATLTAVAGSATPHTPGALGLFYGSVDPTLALPDRTGVAPGFGGAAVPAVGVRAV